MQFKPSRRPPASRLDDMDMFSPVVEIDVEDITTVDEEQQQQHNSSGFYCVVA